MSPLVNRIELAKRFLQQQQKQRDDIVGAWIGGSTAQGEDTESSDIDMILVVSSDQKAMQRGGVDTWLDGVYVEAVTLPITWIGSAEEALRNPFSATHMNHALILYDATGILTQQQEAVRASYMEPYWLKMRLQFWLDDVSQHVQGLQTAIGQHNPLQISLHAGRAMWGFISVPLLRVGLAPSSSRGLLQLALVNKPLHDQIADFEGSRDLRTQDILALEPLFREWIPFADYDDKGNAPEYVAKKAVWLAQQGLPQAALHALWVYLHLIVKDCIDHQEKAVPAAVLAQRWLEAVKWDNEAILQQKGAMAQLLLEELAVLATDLPD
jgi:predicted nucleotidyltransferase